MENRVGKEGGHRVNKKRYILVLTPVLLILSLVFGVFTSNVPEVSASKVKDYSIYYRASEIATAFGSSMAPESEDATQSSDLGKSWVSNISAGNAGGLLGYSRDLKEDEGGVMGWITSDFSANSVTYSFEQLRALGGGGDDETSAADNGLLGYALYGAQLDRIGLVNRDDRGVISSISGVIYQGLYFIAKLVPSIFSLMMRLLVIFNPFQLFFGVIDGLSSSDVAMIGPLAKTVGDLYSTVQNLALYVTIPVMIGLTMVSIFMFQGNSGKKLLRVFVRVFMIFAGLPLIGATYTSIIGEIGDKMNMSTTLPDYIIATQFVDTEGWVKTSRLAPPGSSSFLTPQNFDITTVDGLKNVYYKDHISRKNVALINSGIKGNEALDVLQDLQATTSTISDITSESGSDNSYNSPKRAVGRIGADLLARYRAKDTFTASDYEGFVKSQLDADDDVSSTVISNMFEPDSSDFINDKDKYKDMFVAGLGSDTYGLRYSIYNMGGLHIDSKYAGIGQFASNVSTDHATEYVSSSGKTMKTAVGLSPLSMYNFLNTKFTTQSLTVYSPTQSSSSFTSNEYDSVSKVNTGFFGLVYGAESIVLLSISTVIGLTYAMSLFKIVITSIPQILSGVFGTAVGSMAMITKLLVSTVVLIFEIIGTITLYAMFDTILISLIIGSSDLLDNSWITGLSETTDFIVVLGASVVTVVVGVAFMLFAIKYNTRFTKMIEEVASDIITRLMGGLDNSLNQGSFMHDPSAVAQAGQAGTIHGADGQLGSEGSGIHAGKVAGGEFSEDSFGDAVGEEKAIDAMKKLGDPSYEGRTEKELLSAAGDRYARRKLADVQDAVGGMIGGPAASLAAVAGIPGAADFVGGARGRLTEAEQSEKQMMMREGSYRRAQNESKGATKDDVESYVTEDSDVAPLSSEMLDKSLGAIAKSSADDIIAEGVNEDSLSYYGGVEPELGVVSDSVGADANTEAYDEDGIGDSDADAQMVSAFGNDADGISLDDEHAHPEGLEPLSPEYDEYVGKLDEASNAQFAVADAHSERAQTLEAEANTMDAEANAILSKTGVSDEDAEKAHGMVREANTMKAKAKAHAKQGAKAQAKGSKLTSKAKSAVSNQASAARTPIATRQSSLVQSAMAEEKAQRKLSGLREQESKVQSQLASARLDPVNGPEKVREASEALRSIQGHIGTTEQELQAQRASRGGAVPELPGNHKSATVFKQNNAASAMAEIQSDAIATLGQMGQVASTVDNPTSVSQVSAAQAEFVNNVMATNRAKTDTLSSKYVAKQAELSTVIDQLDTATQANDYPAMNRLSKAIAPIEQDISNMKVERAKLDGYMDLVIDGYNGNKDKIQRDAHGQQGDARTARVRRNQLRDSRSRRGRIDQTAKRLSAITDPQINNQAQIKSKAKILEAGLPDANGNNVPIRTVEDAQAYYRQQMKPLDKHKREMEVTEKSMKRNKELGHDGNYQRDKLRYDKQLAEYRTASRPMRQNIETLKTNMAGLFAERNFVPKQASLTGGRPINGDVRGVTRLVQDYALDQARLETLRKDNRPSTEIENFEKVVQGRQAALRSAGITSNALRDSKTSMETSKALNAELDAILDPNTK